MDCVENKAYTSGPYTTQGTWTVWGTRPIAVGSIRHRAHGLCGEQGLYQWVQYHTGHMDCVENKAHTSGSYTTQGTWTVWGTRPIAVGPIPHRTHGLCGDQGLYQWVLYHTGHMDCVGNKAHSSGSYTTQGTWTVWRTRPIPVGPIPHRAHGLCGEQGLYQWALYHTGHMDCVENKAYTSGSYTTQGTWTVWRTRPIPVGPIPHRAHGLCGEQGP